MLGRCKNKRCSGRTENNNVSFLQRVQMRSKRISSVFFYISYISIQVTGSQIIEFINKSGKDLLKYLSIALKKNNQELYLTVQLHSLFHNSFLIIFFLEKSKTKNPFRCFYRQEHQKPLNTLVFSVGGRDKQYQMLLYLGLFLFGCITHLQMCQEIYSTMYLMLISADTPLHKYG